MMLPHQSTIFYRERVKEFIQLLVSMKEILRDEFRTFCLTKNQVGGKCPSVDTPVEVLFAKCSNTKIWPPYFSLLK